MFNEVCAGFSAGVAGTVLGFPLDSLKTRMQTSSSSSSGNITITRAGSLIYQEGGILAFYRGIGSPLLALTILNTLNFSSYAYYRKLLNVSDKRLEKGHFEYKVPIAAGLVGPLSSMISTPFELVKTQMQLDLVNSKSGQRNFNNSLHAAYKLTTKNGISSLYIGHGVNTLREVVFLGTYFTVYEHLKVTLFRFTNNVSSSSIVIPIAGGCSGAIGWFISFPLDLIKANKQGIIINEHNLKNRKSLYQITKMLLDTRGIVGLYSGVVPSIVRAFIVSSTRFSVYEFVLWFLK